MAEEEKGITRRNLIKVGGAAGAAAAVAAVFSEAREAGLRPSTYTGWEERQGKTYLDRRPFEVDTPESYEVVGTLKRRDTRTYDTRARVGAPPRGNNSLDKYDAGDPFWVDYYETNQDDGDGISPLEKDKDFQNNWYPGEKQKIDDGMARKTEFANTGEGFLAAVRANSYAKYSFPKITTPPEENDWDEVNPRRAQFASPEAAAEFIKRLCHDYDATLCRITKTNPAWFYANGCRGAPQNDIGTEFPIRSWWEYAIVITRPMNFETLAADPNFGCSYDGYTPASMSCWLLMRALKSLGYPARVASPRQGYEQFAVPHAVDAGFGELARTCNCVSPDMGGNFRPGMVYTSLPMAIDKPINCGVNDFCIKCKICAEYCPTSAISMADEWNYELAGVRRWDVDGFHCVTGWDQVSGKGNFVRGEPGPGLRGCRACIATCPWFRKFNWLHTSIRSILASDPTRITHDVAMWFEKNMYPRNPTESYLVPELKGVHDPPEWLRTENYISSFTETPMGVK